MHDVKPITLVLQWSLRILRHVVPRCDQSVVEGVHKTGEKASVHKVLFHDLLKFIAPWNVHPRIDEKSGVLRRIAVHDEIDELFSGLDTKHAGFKRAKLDATAAKAGDRVAIAKNGGHTEGRDDTKNVDSNLRRVLNAIGDTS